MADRVVSAFDEPLLQRIGAQVLVHDQHRSSRGRQPTEPRVEHGVQFGLPDPDRRIAPDEVETEIRVDVGGVGDLQIGERQSSGIAFGQFARPRVHVDGDHPSLRSAAGQGQRDRPGSAPEVEEHSIGRRRGSVGEKELGSRVEAAVREDAVVGVELEGVVGKDHRHASRS